MNIIYSWVPIYSIKSKTNKNLQFLQFTMVPGDQTVRNFNPRKRHFYQSIFFYNLNQKLFFKSVILYLYILFRDVIGKRRLDY